MSNSFLTVEDINSNYLKYYCNDFYVLDTSKLGVDEYDDLKYDFVICGHQFNANVSENNHFYTFKINSSLWTGGYYFTKANGEYIAQDASFDSGLNTLSFLTSEADVKLVLYLCSFRGNDALRVQRLRNKILECPDYILNKHGLISNIKPLKCLNLLENAEYNFYFDKLKIGINKTVGLDFDYYYLVLLKKTELLYDLSNTNLIVGEINHVRLGVNNDYLPGGELVGEDALDVKVVYNNKILTVDYDSKIRDYCFDLDLTSKTDKNSVNIDVIVYENDLINPSRNSFKLSCDYLTVNNFNDLQLNCFSGASIIQLNSDISLEGNIVVGKDTKLYGNQHSINCNGYYILVSQDKVFNADKVLFTHGDPTIIQENNTKVVLTECNFNNCSSNNYNNMGSVIYCKNNLENLNIENDFITILKKCSITNVHSAIFHGGNLTIDECKFHQTDISYVNKYNPAFLYQTDGEATIRNSIFDIDYLSEAYCVNQKNIGFAQALIKCGEHATVNNANQQDLSQDNNLPFFDEGYNNQSHVFCKYYYPKLNICVYSSPVMNLEDKCVAYCVSGSDWIFKKGLQVTRADSDSENTIRKINWEGQ